MKKVIGSILCFVAIVLILSHIIGQKPDITEHKIQDWAVIGVLLAIGIPLSTVKKKPESTNKKCVGIMNGFPPNKITGANAGGPRELPLRMRWAAGIAQFRCTA